MTGCVHCAHEIAETEAACVWCGRWQNGHMPMCETHPTVPSVGLCVACARPVCGTCLVNDSGRLFCDRPEHRAFAAEHHLVARFESEYDADWVCLLLHRTGIPSVVFSFRDYASSWWFPVDDPVRLFVPNARASEAGAMIADANEQGHLA